MSSANPYFIGDEDDDILGEAPKNARSNAKIIGPNGESIPAELAEALRKYIDVDISNETNLHDISVPLVVYASADLISFYSDLIKPNSDIHIISALCDVVNRMSEGMLEDYVDLHDSRHSLIMIHVAREYSSIIWKAAEGAPEEMDSSKLSLFLGTYHKFLDWKFDQEKVKYISTCSKLEISPDYNLIDTGNLTDYISQKLYRPAFLFSVLKALSTEKDNNNGNNSK